MRIVVRALARSLPVLVFAGALAAFLPALGGGLPQLGRRRELPGQPPLSRPRPGRAPVDAHRRPHGPLHPGDVAHPGPGPCPLGHESGGLPSDLPHVPRHQRRAGLCLALRLLALGFAPIRDDDRFPLHLGRRRRRAPLRAAPAARGIRGLGHRAPRCGERMLRPGLRPRLPDRGAARGAIGPARTRAGWLAAAGAFLLAAFAKSIVVGLPIVLLALDVYPLRRLSRRTLVPVLVEKLPFVGGGRRRGGDHAGDRLRPGHPRARGGGQPSRSGSRSPATASRSIWARRCGRGRCHRSTPSTIPSSPSPPATSCRARSRSRSPWP